MTKDDVLIEVKGLKTRFFTDEGVVNSVDGADFFIKRGKTLCLVGESGCGKSVTARSILRIVDRPGRIVEGEVRFHRDSGEVVDLARLDPRGPAMRAIRGKDIAMIFQEPMASLSPVHTIGNQIMEAVQLHFGATEREARIRAVELLEQVEIPRPESRLESYVFQLSGGMRQRAMIAMALSCRPTLLIADEPTTALDVTTQANILELLAALQSELGMAMLFITHDLGVVAEIADDVAVMYLGKIVERGDVDAIFHDPHHPYTRSLLRSIPALGQGGATPLEAIPGMVPHPFARPEGCGFHPRCGHVIAGVCDRKEPPATQFGVDREVRCFLHRGEKDVPADGPQPRSGTEPG